MKISFFRFNIEPTYWEAVKKFLENNEVEEMDLRECLKHSSTNFVIEKASRYVIDQITDGRDIYSGQSQRYVNFKDSTDFFYIPDEVTKKGYKQLYIDHINDMISRYSKMIDLGIPAEDARFIFPAAFFSNMKFTLHGDKLIDFFIFNYHQNLKEHKDIADALLDNFRGKYDVLVDNILKIVKSKERQFKNQEKAKRLWKSMLKPGQFNVFYHNDLVLESALGASICYRKGAPSEYIESFGLEEQEALLRKIIASGHESVTEHAFFSIQCSLSRVGHQQLRRHRIPTRSYTSIFDAAENYSYVTPPTIEANSECKDLYTEGMERCKKVYDELIAKGVSKESACYVLPNGIRLDIILTTNLRDIKHILRHRLCERAQWEFRELAYKIFEELYTKSPTLFSDLGPSCYLNKCKEGEFSCGKPYVFRNFIERLKNRSN